MCTCYFSENKTTYKKKTYKKKLSTLNLAISSCVISYGLDVHQLKGSWFGPPWAGLLPNTLLEWWAPEKSETQGISSQRRNQLWQNNTWESLLISNEPYISDSSSTPKEKRLLSNEVLSTLLPKTSVLDWCFLSKREWNQKISSSGILGYMDMDPSLNLVLILWEAWNQNSPASLNVLDLLCLVIE